MLRSLLLSVAAAAAPPLAHSLSHSYSSVLATCQHAEHVSMCSMVCTLCVCVCLCPNVICVLAHVRIRTYTPNIPSCAAAVFDEAQNNKTMWGDTCVWVGEWMCSRRELSSSFKIHTHSRARTPNTTEPCEMSFTVSRAPRIYGYLIVSFYKFIYILCMHSYVHIYTTLLWLIDMIHKLVIATHFLFLLAFSTNLFCRLQIIIRHQNVNWLEYVHTLRSIKYMHVFNFKYI